MRMAAFERDHWWYRTLHHFIHKTIREAFGSGRNISILDAGCGTGGTLLYLKNRGYKDIAGFDISELAVDVCRKRNLDVIREDIRSAGGRFASESKDVIVCTDILYFLAENETAAVLRNLASLLKHNGILIVNVPALRAFRGTHDIAVGIKRRFSKRDAINFFSAAGLTIERMYYWPFFLSLPIFFTRLFQRIRIRVTKRITGEKADAAVSDLKEYPEIVNTGLFYFNRIEAKLFGNVRLFGSSLFVCARRIKAL